MSFFAFYIIASLSILVGGLFWWFNRRFTLGEWALCVVAAFVTAGAVHWSVASGMTADEEVESGQVVSVNYRPAWRERYLQAIYRTVYHSSGSGKNRRTWTTQEFSHYETRHTNHPDEWTAATNIQMSLDLSHGHYDAIVAKFGGAVTAHPGRRTTFRTGSTMVSGDRNDYSAQNLTGHVEPVLKGVSFENRVRASPSVFSYRQLSEAESKRLPDYPAATDPWKSSRAMAAVDGFAWDQMNARLGPTKHVNVIVVRLGSAGEAHNLEAKWIGGKKNDLVITFGSWGSYVFGWSETTITKRNLETLLTTEVVNDALIPKIEAEIAKTYRAVDWHKFDYLDLEPRPKHIWILVSVMVLVQGLLVGWSLFNEIDKQHRR